MLSVAKHQTLDGLRDAKFLFLATLILLAFIVNGFVYAQWYESNMQDWRESTRVTSGELEEKQDNLQKLSNHPQRAVKPPSVLAFIADSGEAKLPDTWTVNAFVYRNPERTLRGNRMMPLVGAIDWSFIIGTLMSLLAIIISFDAVCGEKRDGTLRLMLSFPLSRLKLFFGKYLGLLNILLIALFVGAFLNVAILISSGVLPVTGPVLMTVGLALVFSVFFLSFILLAGMAVSSMVSRPVVALVVLMVGWVLFVVAVPGLARPIAEMSVPVQSNFEVRRVVEAAVDDLQASASKEALTQYSDPFHENVPLRAEFFRNMLSVRQRLEDESNESRIRQAEMINTISSVSPSCLLRNAFGELSGTGAAGFRTLMRTARRYQQQLHAFTVEKDRTDPNSPHHVFSWGTGVEPGVFSQLPMAMSEIPRWHRLWLEGGLPTEQGFPIWQDILFIVLNLNMALVAFIALARYDPR